VALEFAAQLVFVEIDIHVKVERERERESLALLSFTFTWFFESEVWERRKQSIFIASRVKHLITDIVVAP
jgi:hypothetical protein